MTQNQLEYLKLQETRKHNEETRAETHRANVAEEGIKRSTLTESARHNQAVETETNRSNLANEAIRYGTLVETQRSNLAKEAENIRSNKARESETYRHNVATEQISLGTLNESIRHNKASESIAWGQIDLGRDQLSETIRHNETTESNTWLSQAADRRVKRKELDLKEDLGYKDYYIKASNLDITGSHYASTDGAAWAKVGATTLTGLIKLAT